MSAKTTTRGIDATIPYAIVGNAIEQCIVPVGRDMTWVMFQVVVVSRKANVVALYVMAVSGNVSVIVLKVAVVTNEVNVALLNVVLHGAIPKWSTGAKEQVVSHSSHNKHCTRGGIARVVPQSVPKGTTLARHIDESVKCRSGTIEKLERAAVIGLVLAAVGGWVCRAVEVERVGCAGAVSQPINHRDCRIRKVVSSNVHRRGRVFICGYR